MRSTRARLCEEIEGINDTGGHAFRPQSIAVFAVPLPAPAILTTQPTLFWGLVASMWIGNVVLLARNLPLVGLWAMLLRVPYRVLYPTIVVLACTGIYAVNHSTFDLLLAAACCAIARSSTPPHIRYAATTHCDTHSGEPSGENDSRLRL